MLGVSGKAARNEGGSQSLLLFTIYLHNFLISLVLIVGVDTEISTR